MTYQEFINRKTDWSTDDGFDPLWMPDTLYDFQQDITAWAIRKGRSAIFADCGLGKTPMYLVWAENVAQKTGGRVLILTPLAVAFQTVREGEKFGVEVMHRQESIEDTDRIVVTNYERLHNFNASDFEAVICDESSILKCFAGATRQAINDFMQYHKYRLLCTATAAPNDYTELGTSAEALGVMRYAQMLSMFFKHDASETQKWRLKKHGEHQFWQWVCTWARAIRKPSDLGYKDGGFALPGLKEVDHVVQTEKAPDGCLFQMPAVGLTEQRDELRRTMQERCETAAELVNKHNEPAVVWCHLNKEGELLDGMIEDGVNVQGSDTEEKKERVFSDFANGNARVIITKPSIAGFGLNWQHCAHQVFFPSHSYEQYYQAVRRSWRFGQESVVKIDVVCTEGQTEVLKNLKRKSEDADRMFAQLVQFMKNELDIKNHTEPEQKEELPSWL